MSSPSPPARLTPGERALVALCRRSELDAGSAPAEVALLADPAVAADVAGLAARQGVHGLVLRRLRHTLGSDAQSHPTAAALLRQLPLLAKQATLWAFEEQRVLSSLRRAAPSFLVLKGGALRHHAYQDPVERAMGDLDLLCRPQDVDALATALRSLGYGSRYPDEARAGFRQHLYHERLTHPNGFEAEVHWGLTRPGSRFPLDPAPFFDRAVTLRVPPHLEVSMPSPEDMIVHLVSQSQQNGVRTLKRIVDLDRAVVASADVDWSYVRAAAATAGLTAYLAVTLRLANLLLDTPVPKDILAGRDVSPIARRWLEVMRPAHRMLRWPSRGRPAADQLFELWCLRSWSSAREALMELVRMANQDPLTWVWVEYEGHEPPRRWAFSGLERIAKLGGVQLAMAARRVAEAVGVGSASPERFWLHEARS